MELEFLGGASEFGRLGFLAHTAQGAFCFDFGLEVQHGGVPQVADPARFVRDLRAIFLSHAHLDHCGALPLPFQWGYRGHLYATPTTNELMSMMLWDALKVQALQQRVIYSDRDIEMVERAARDMLFRQPLELKGARVTMFDAGHMPGSASTLLEADGRRVLFTGDIKFSETRLMKGADTKVNADVLITEGTYWDRNHPSRADVEKQLRVHALEVLEGGGSLLLPAFALGRTQELLLILHDIGWPVYVDGMGAEATERMLLHHESMKDVKALARAFGSVNRVRREKDRIAAVEKPSVVISTAGMLNGGPIHSYIKRLLQDEKSSLVFTGFQVPGTVGQVLKDTGVYKHGEHNVRPKFRMSAMDFSAHAGRDTLMDFIEQVAPKKVLVVHTDTGAGFAEELRGLGFDAVAPKVGERVKL